MNKRIRKKRMKRAAWWWLLQHMPELATVAGKYTITPDNGSTYHIKCDKRLNRKWILEEQRKIERILSLGRHPDSPPDGACLVHTGMDAQFFIDSVPVGYVSDVSISSDDWPAVPVLEET